MNHVLSHCFCNVSPLHGNDLHKYGASGAQGPLAGIHAKWDTALKAGRVMQRLSGSLSSVGSGDTSLCDIKLCSSLWCVGVKWSRRVICQPQCNMERDDYNIEPDFRQVKLKIDESCHSVTSKLLFSSYCCYWAITWLSITYRPSQLQPCISSGRTIGASRLVVALPMSHASFLWLVTCLSNCLSPEITQRHQTNSQFCTVN